MTVDVRTDAPSAQVETVPTDGVRSPDASRWRKPLGIAALVMIPVLMYLGLVFAPEDAQQGPAQRIFYIHVPAAWIGFLAFFVVFVSSIAFLVTKKRRYDDIASSSAEVGVIFTTGVLVTGPLWGRPVWGVYWTWDPRLTSFLMLWLIYLSYLVLRGYVSDPQRRATYSAVLGIVGFLDVPIVYLSVRWWRSEHPLQLVFERNGLPAEMLYALLFGVATFTVLYAYLLIVRLRVGRLKQRLEEEVAQ
jgi:heme exporter protein C